MNNIKDNEEYKRPAVLIDNTEYDINDGQDIYTYAFYAKTHPNYRLGDRSAVELARAQTRVWDRKWWQFWKPKTVTIIQSYYATPPNIKDFGKWRYTMRKFLQSVWRIFVVLLFTSMFVMLVLDCAIKVAAYLKYIH